MIVSFGWEESNPKRNVYMCICDVQQLLFVHWAPNVASS